LLRRDPFRSSRAAIVTVALAPPWHVVLTSEIINGILQEIVIGIFRTSPTSSKSIVCVDADESQPNVAPDSLGHVYFANEGDHRST
jgi:hypothetical protein